MTTVDWATAPPPTTAREPDDGTDDAGTAEGTYAGTGGVHRLRSLFAVWFVATTTFLCLLFLYAFCRSGTGAG